MYKRKIFTGYCPTQEDDYSIAITYTDSSVLHRASFTKNSFKCDYNRFGDKCSCECPIFQNAPEEL